MVGPVGNPIVPLPITPLSDGEINLIRDTAAIDLLEPGFLSISEYHGSVSTAVVGQQAQDLIGNLALSENRRQIFLAAIAHVREVAYLVSLAADYRNAQAKALIQLTNMTLKQQTLTNNYNSLASTLPVSQLNAAILTLNVAQIQFNNFLPTYQSGLNAYNNAATTYSAAVDTFDQAMATYNSSAKTAADQSTLLTAAAVFGDAKTTFNNAASTFNLVYQGQMSSYSSDLSAARSNYNTAANNYNIALQSNSDVADFNDLINDWNSSIDALNGYINTMNNFSDNLSLNQIPLAQHAPLVTNYTLATEVPDQLFADTSTLYGTTYSNITSLNSDLLSTNAGIVTIASTSFPAIAYLFPLGQAPVPAFATGSTSYSTIPYFSSLAVPNLPSVTFVNPYSNIPPIGSLGELGNTLTRIDDQDYTLNTSSNARIGSRSSDTESAGGAGSSTQMTVIDPKAEAANPFSESALSKQSFEATLGIYGVTLASPLVDQVNALIMTLTEASGLTSTGLAQDLISTSSVNTDNQDTGIRFTLALANLNGLIDLIDNGTLREGLKQILQQDASFNALSTDEQSALLDSLTQEVGASMLTAALANIAEQFGMPGLIPQLLAAAAGVGDGDALGSLQSQLYYSSVFADELQATLNLPQDVAISIASQAVAEAAATPEGITPDTLTQAAVRLLNEQGISSDTLTADVNAAAIATDQAVEEQIASQELAQREAYADSLTRSLLGKGILDQTQAARITQELVNGSQDKLDEIALNSLKEFNLSQEELDALLKEANRAADIHNAELNPVAGLVTNAPITTLSAQTGFEALSSEILRPVFGDAQAIQISSDYGRLIFSSPNSILVRLQDRDRAHSNTAAVDHSTQLSSDYYNFTNDIRNPMTATGNPLQLGETLLLTANMSGPSGAGITSVDNQLGVFGNAHYNPAGILG